MDITKHLKKGSYRVTMKGRFTFDDHPAFGEIIERLSDADIERIELDMHAVEFVDSAALGMLLLAQEEAAKHQKLIAIIGATGQVEKMFKLAHFEQYFTLQQ